MLQKYEEKLVAIQDQILELGQNVLKANEMAMEAVTVLEDEQFTAAKKQLKNQNEKSDEIDNLIVTTLALFSPEAKDLRALVVYLKITNEFIRAGSNTRSYIRDIRKCLNCGLDMKLVTEYATMLHRATIKAFTMTIDMIKEADIEEVYELYHQVAVEESKTDDLYEVIEKDVFNLINDNKELSREYFDFLSACRRLEKVADRAVSIAQLLVYAKKGGELHQG
jgi:phosphate transport system protein